jgi:hypothetical protein
MFAKMKAASAKGRAAKVAAHSDVAEDKKLVKKMVRPDALTGRAAGGAAPKKSGGKGKGKTQVNVIVAPRAGGDRPVPVPVPASGAGAGPSGPMPSRPPVPPPSPSGPPPGLAGLRNAPPPGAGPMAKGGKVKRRANGGATYTAGAASAEGREEKIKAYGSKARAK